MVIGDSRHIKVPKSERNCIKNARIVNERGKFTSGPNVVWFNRLSGGFTLTVSFILYNWYIVATHMHKVPKLLCLHLNCLYQRGESAQPLNIQYHI